MMPSSRSVAFWLKTTDASSVERGHAMSVAYRLAGRARLIDTRLRHESSGTREVAEAGRGVVRHVIEPLPVSSTDGHVSKLAAIEVTRGSWRLRIDVASVGLTSFASVPRTNRGGARLVLWIARRDRVLATELVMSVQLEMAARALEAAEAMARLPRRGAGQERGGETVSDPGDG